MLRLKALGPNCHEVTDGQRTVLFSYATPVAMHIDGQGYFRSTTKHSVTTSRHVNAFTGGADRGQPVSQESLDSIGLLGFGQRTS